MLGVSNILPHNFRGLILSVRSYRYIIYHIYYLNFNSRFKYKNQFFNGCLRFPLN